MADQVLGQQLATKQSSLPLVSCRLTVLFQPTHNRGLGQIAHLPFHFVGVCPMMMISNMMVAHITNRATDLPSRIPAI